MERLNKPVDDGGAPYTNLDFYTILQQNHLLSYSAFLDEINDVSTGNSGIIIKGITPYNPASDQGQNGIFEYNFVNSMVYINGEFLEPSDFFSTQSVYTFSSPEFYIYKAEDPSEKRSGKVTDLPIDVTQYSYYDISTSFPNTEHYIKVDHELIRNPVYDQNTGAFLYYTNLYLFKCSRYLKRILRYHRAEYGQLYMTMTYSGFRTMGQLSTFGNISGSAFRGYGDMYGFELVNYKGGENSPEAQEIYDFLQVSSTIGFDVNSPTTPENSFDPASVSTGTILNYGRLRNTGGSPVVRISIDNMPPHRHTDTSGPDNNMDHTHYLEVADRITSPDPDPRKNTFLRSTSVYTKSQNNHVVTQYGQPIHALERNAGFNYKLINDDAGNNFYDLNYLNTYQVNTDKSPSDTLKDLRDHRHYTRSYLKSGQFDEYPDPTNTNVLIPNTDQLIPGHYNDPPIFRVWYYTKINPYIDNYDTPDPLGLNF